MATPQSILEQLASMGFDTSGGWGSLGNLQSSDVAQTVGRHFMPASSYEGSTPYEEALSKAFLPSMFSSITPESLEASSMSYYSPRIGEAGKSLLSNLSQGLSGQKAVGASGGFAGSGAFGKYQQGVKDVYGKSLGSEIAKSFSARTQSLQSIQDLINQWQRSAIEIAPPKIDEG